MSTAEFLVRGVSLGTENALITGVVGKGSVVRGATFRILRTKDSLEQSVELVVTKIVTYRRDVIELPNGMSGDLYLAGVGVALIQHNDVLEW